MDDGRVLGQVSGEEVTEKEIKEERERAALICDAIAIRELYCGASYMLEGGIGDHQDEALNRAFTCGDTTAFVKRALEIDTDEARICRADVCGYGRLAWWVRSGRGPLDFPVPRDWRKKT